MLTTLLQCILTVIRVQVEQKARREDVLNQLLVLLNTAIHRKDREPAAGGGGRARQRRTASKMEIVMPARCVYCVTVLYCTVLCLLPAPRRRRTRARRVRPTTCPGPWDSYLLTDLYCTVLYCIVLYCTVWGSGTHTY